MKNQKRAQTCLALLALAVLATQVGCGKTQVGRGFDWPRWRGPDGNGISQETGWNPAALQNGAKILWAVDVGVGCSNIAIRDNRLYTMGLGKKARFTFSCLNAATGREIWRRTFASSGEPESTPTLDGDRVYGLGKDGTLLCLRAADGRPMWTKNVMTDFKVPSLYYGWATSPIVAGDFLLINANSAGIALNKNTGDIVWNSGSSETDATRYGYYATPVLWDLQNRRCALFYGPMHLSAVEVETGNRLWSIAHNDFMHPIDDPVVFENKVIFSTFYECIQLAITDNIPAQTWSNRWFITVLATPVLVDGYLYGTHRTQSVGDLDWAGLLRLVQPFTCIDARTGELKWTNDMGVTTLTAADGKLIVLEGNGMLHILEATPLEYRELSSADLYAGANKPRRFFSPPVLCDGRIYCRNFNGDLICVDASGPAAAADFD